MLYAGLITVEGTLTSEAAILCRSLGKVCITGVSDIHLEALGFVQNDSIKNALVVPNCPTLLCGDNITLDGSRYEFCKNIIMNE